MNKIVNGLINLIKEILTIQIFDWENDFDNTKFCSHISNFV